MPNQLAFKEHVFGNRRLHGLCAAVTGALLMASCAMPNASGSAEPETDHAVSLRIADDYSPSHQFAEYGVSVFMEELAHSGVGIDYFPSGQLGSPEDLAVLLQEGVVDISATAPAYLEDRFPLTSVSDLPSKVGDSCVAANAMMDLLSEGGILYEEEFAPRGLRPLWVAVLPSYELITIDRRVEHPSDAEGLLIRSAGGALDPSTVSIRAAAVSMSGGETFEAMARNTVDGAAFPYSSANQYGLQDVAKFSTDGLNMGAFNLPYVISDEAWGSLSPAQQETVEQAAELANQTLCDGINEEAQTAKQQMREDGMTFVSIDESNSAEWDELLSGVRDEWAESLDEAGMPATDVLNAYDEAVAKYESQ